MCGCVAWQGREWEASVSSGGIPCWQGLCGHTHFQQGLNMTLLFQNGLLIYTHQGLRGLSCLLK